MAQVFVVVAKGVDVAMAPTKDDAETLRKGWLADHPTVGADDVTIDEREGDHHPTWSQKPDEKPAA